MNDALKTVIPSLIALTGTVAVALVGYRQWKRQQDTSRESDYRTQRQQTYKELWEKLEDIHVRLRTEEVGGDEFSSLVRDVNSFILKRGLYLERDDQDLANCYLSKVREFTDLVRACGSPEAKISMSKTETLPPPVVQFAQESGRIQGEVNELREQLLVRYRKALTGGKA
jgi:hypothetical protein